MNNVKMNLVMLLDKCDFINSGSVYCIFLNGQDHNFKYKALSLMQESMYSVPSQCLDNEWVRKSLEELHPEESKAFKLTTTDGTKVAMFPLHFAVGRLHFKRQLSRWQHHMVQEWKSAATP